jgi:hypothetical protein
LEADLVEKIVEDILDKLKHMSPHVPKKGLEELLDTSHMLNHCYALDQLMYGLLVFGVWVV